jgi:phosphoribosylformimino-5-aminoimidazole carboxamide ribotide isomerase
MIVFPAVDIRQGRCVRLHQGKPATAQTYFKKPWQAAVHWQHQGARALHVVDLDGALGGSQENSEAIASIFRNVDVPVQVGGGLRTTEAVESMFDAGAARIVVGTRAVLDREWTAELCERFPGRIIIALDAKEGVVTVNGWQKSANRGVEELATELEDYGPAAILYTDVTRDGMLTRPHFEGVSQLLATVNVPVIASGGVSDIDDVKRLAECGADGVIVGKALYEGRIKLKDALEVAEQVPTRLSLEPQREIVGNRNNHLVGGD